MFTFRIMAFAMAVAAFPAALAQAGTNVLCSAIVTKDVAAVDEPSSVLHKGQHIDDLVELDVTPTGETRVCEYRAWCYPSHAFKLLGCKIKSRSAFNGGMTFTLEGSRVGIPGGQLRYDDLTNRFNEMGLCSACADNVAMYYIHKPHSRCGELARQALEGNPDAVARLRDDPDFCTWHCRSLPR